MNAVGVFKKHTVGFKYICFSPKLGPVSESFFSSLCRVNSALLNWGKTSLIAMADMHLNAKIKSYRRRGVRGGGG